ncbi:unnamed protein product [Aureobasidium uvarum]|uniref:Uncharacterized protein n=1 Tax=Aureobasidium uvarum TaxID=2773716 RepID=A0A9N8PYG0_9PEZI|nr:unnamed protein product [Aureobasidium uvarum]
MAPGSGRSVIEPPRPGKEYPPMTAGAHKKVFGGERVSLLDVLKKVRPHSPTTQALEERASREGPANVDDETPMQKFTEEDWVRIQDEAIPLASKAPERKKKAEVQQRDQRAARRREKEPIEQPAARRSGRRTEEVSYAESDSGSEYAEPTSASSSGSSKLFVSPVSEKFSPRPRGVKRKRATEKETTAAATRSPSRSVTPAPPIKRHSTRRTTLADSDDEMSGLYSRSRSITPAPPIRKYRARRTTLADSDDEMTEASRSHSVTPAPPVKKRRVAGRLSTVLEDSDDEMMERSPSRKRSVTPVPPIKKRTGR